MDDFGFIRPPKWGKIMSYHDGLWTIAYVHHVSPLIHNGKGNEVVTLNDSEFDYLIAETRMRQIVYTNIRNQKFQGDISIDTKVVPKHRRQYIDLKFTIPCGKRFGEDNVKADDREYTFCMISDYRACDVGKGKTKDVWVITYDDNTQHFMFEEDLLTLMSNKVDYDLKSKKLTLKNITRRVVDHCLFEGFIIVCILLSCVVLILEKEYDECDEDLNIGCEEPHKDTWYNFDLIFTIIFSVEMCFKMIGYGLFTAKPPGYFRDSWNYLDFVIVVEGIISLSMSSSSSAIKSIRALRILRSLRMITHLDGLREIISYHCVSSSRPRRRRRQSK